MTQSKMMIKADDIMFRCKQDEDTHLGRLDCQMAQDKNDIQRLYHICLFK